MMTDSDKNVCALLCSACIVNIWFQLCVRLQTSSMSPSLSMGQLSCAKHVSVDKWQQMWVKNEPKCQHFSIHQFKGLLFKPESMQLILFPPSSFVCFRLAALSPAFTLLILRLAGKHPPTLLCKKREDEDQQQKRVMHIEANKHFRGRKVAIVVLWKYLTPW